MREGLLILLVVLVVHALVRTFVLQVYAIPSGSMEPLLEPGDHVIAGDDLYGGTYRLFERVRRRSMGLDFSYVDWADLDAARAAIKPNTKMVWVETPTNPMLKLADLAAIAGIAKEHGLISVADNTFASPLLQRPLEHGFDVVLRLWSPHGRHGLRLRTRCPRADARVPSLAGVFAGADWHEREAWDMMGIRFEGHPNLRRILMEDDWEGHPLRKDYPIGGEPVRFSEDQ